MAQIKFQANMPYSANAISQISSALIYFQPVHFLGSLSLLSVHLHAGYANSAISRSFTTRLGLYSLSGSTLSLHNSLSATNTVSGGGQSAVILLSATSATQNITPGTWWFGIHLSLSNTNATSVGLARGGAAAAVNDFPGGFTGGVMTATTAGLVASIATSDLGISGTGANVSPYIILSG